MDYSRNIRQRNAEAGYLLLLLLFVRCDGRNVSQRQRVVRFSEVQTLPAVDSFQRKHDVGTCAHGRLNHSTSPLRSAPHSQPRRVPIHHQRTRFKHLVEQCTPLLLLLAVAFKQDCNTASQNPRGHCTNDGTMNLQKHRVRH